MGHNALDGASFNVTPRIFNPGLESSLLVFVAHLEPELEKHNATFYDVLFKQRAKLKKASMLLLCAKAHHVFHAGAVVPAAIKDQDFARRWKMRTYR